jgi:hypothetical protein
MITILLFLLYADRVAAVAATIGSVSSYKREE